MRKVTRMLSRLMMALAVMTTLLASRGYAETTITIGTGTVQSTHPFYTLYETGRAQYIYLASEMAGLSAGPLTKIGYNFVAINFPWLKGLTIKMKNTTSTTFGSTTFDEAGWTTVYYNVQYNPVVGWNTFVLNTPFLWDGTSNLMVNVCYQNGVGEWTTYDYVYGTTTGTNYRSLYARNDNSAAPNIGCVMTGQTRTYTRPNIRLSQPGPGTLAGQVTNAMTGAPIATATVTVGTTVATTNGTGNYTMTVISGPVSATAAKATYSPLTKTTTVPEGGTATLNFALYPIPAVLNGVVTNAANAAPVKGAKVTVNGWSTYTVEGGAYSLNVYTFGSYPIQVSKAGFSDLTTANYTFTSGVTQTVNLGITEYPNKPSQPFTAALNAPPTQVNLTWGIPTGDYELIYDDGVAETTTDWAIEGNMNAVKFTAINYPVTVKGGSVNIGKDTDYPNGTQLSDLEPFEMQVFDATGPGGTPGVAIGSPVEVTPTSWGWNTFAFPNIPIASGNFYIVMIQGGNDPVCARLAIDNTATQLRSYSRFVTGMGPWLPADGNFMIRSVVNGVGGPVDSPEGIIGYQVWRLKQTEEGNPALWTSVATPTGTSTIDNSWPSLGDGAYRWAVKAKYTGSVWSDAIFSNVLGKNWTSNVTVNVTLTCDAMPKAGSLVMLTCNDVGVDSAYSGLTDATGKVVFPLVWKGNYHLKVTRFAFDDYNATVAIDASPKTFDVNLLYIKSAPTDMTVDEGSLLCTWNPPVFEIAVFDEPFNDWTTHGWDHEGNWRIGTTYGQPAPDAEYYWSPEVYNYEDNITSQNLSGIGSSGLMLSFDMYYDDFGGGEYIGLSCEISEDGTSWESVAEFTAANGSIAWANYKYDISSYTNKTFKIRFRSWGDDSYYMNWWEVDNVKILATENAKACVIAYNVYLNNVLDGVTTDTSYMIPGTHLVYGNNYDACVKAVYGSGYSTASCDNFTSRWLCPPTDLVGVAEESTAYLTWTKPYCPMGGGPEPQWIRWDDGTNSDAIGTGGAANFDIAAHWDPSQITLLDGGAVTKIAFYPASSGTATYRARVWKGVNAATLLVDQAVASVTLDAWNEVTITTPPEIDITQDLWIGMNVNATAGYPAGCDNGPAIDYYGDMIYFGGVWSSMHVAYALDYNWNLAAYIEPAKKKALSEPVVLVQDPPVIDQGRLAVSGHMNPGGPNATHTNGMMAPVANPVLLGYNVYRDGAPIAYINDVNTLEYYDFNLNPGVYNYTVKGYYDVSPVPPGNDNSPAAGPATVVINYGFPLPFYEPWDEGNFSYYSWSHGSNWSITPAYGNPAPSADFSWQPALTNYSESIETAALSAGPYVCAHIWLDFDYKLVDRNHTGAEFLTVELYSGGGYQKVAEFANNGDVNWTPQHVELKSVLGKAFKVRFRANGTNSLDILHWYVDNIKVYAECIPATDLDYTQSQNHVTLTWTAPVCSMEDAFTIIWDDNSHENGYSSAGGERWYGNLFPMDPTAEGYITSFDVMFFQSGTSASTEVHFEVFDENYNLIGTGDPFMQESEVWQNITVPNIPFTGTFLGMVYSNNTGVRPHYQAADENGPNAALDYGMRYDGSVWQTLGQYSGVPAVFLLRVHGIIIVPSSEGPDGYNVYRSDATGMPPYTQVNTQLIGNTSYTDVIPLANQGTYKYYVSSVYLNEVDNSVVCDPSSDTITVLFPAVGMSEIGTGSISIFPNPATEVLNVKSDYTISAIEVMNFVGQSVYTSTGVSSKTAKLNVSTYSPGVYFVKVTTSEGTRTVKITVTH